MKRALFAAGMWALAVLSVRGEDLVTRSGTTYRDVRPARVEPDGVTWRYARGAVKVDFDDSPESVRRAYHYDPAKAAAYRQAQAETRARADEQARHDVSEHESRQRAHVQAALAKDDATATLFRRALSPAASDATRQVAAQMQADAEKHAADESANPDQMHLVPTLPSALGPRPVNRFMNTPSGKEYVASLHDSSTAGEDPEGPSAGLRNTSIRSEFFTPLYMTRSYYEDVERSEAFVRGVPLKP